MSVESPAVDLSHWSNHLRDQIASAEDSGYFGPGSATWQINREGAMALGLARALLLQLAHPWVAQAVDDHSTVHSQPMDRLMATGAAAILLTFGSRSQADAAAARIRGVHQHIHGTLKEDTGRWRRGEWYTANDPEALRWVLATLVDTSLTLYEALLGPIPEAFVRRYLEEARVLGAMVEIPPNLVPRTRAELRGYMDGMIADGTVCVGEPAYRLARDLDALRRSGKPLWRLFGVLTLQAAALTMPPALAVQYDLPPRGLVGRRAGKAAARASRLLLPRLPESMRVDPVTLAALRRADRGRQGVANHVSPDRDVPADRIVAGRSIGT